MEKKATFEDDGMCFVCGKRNPIGLKLEFEFDEKGRLTGTFTPTKELQGFKDVLHGGIIATLLDEVMVTVLLKLGRKVVSSSLTVKLHKPAPIGEELTIIGEVERERGKVYEMKGEVRGSDGILLATGKSVCVRVG